MDGTGQTEFYGNNSWFPTTIAHARGIPGTQKVMAILCGHHTSQAGKLAVIDPAKGRQENSGVQLIAPVRATPAERIDGYGQEGELWQYPFPLTERECVVGYAPLGWDAPDRRRGDADFGIYWMDMDGRRELLASDRPVPCSQPVPLAARPRPDAAAEPGGLPADHAARITCRTSMPGSGLARRAARHREEAARGGAGVSGRRASATTPAAARAAGRSCQHPHRDRKRQLGREDRDRRGHGARGWLGLFHRAGAHAGLFPGVGSAGSAVQTMRSWSTLQPGEKFGCVGCHEHAQFDGSGRRHAVQPGVESRARAPGACRGHRGLQLSQTDPADPESALRALSPRSRRAGRLSCAEESPCWLQARAARRRCCSHRQGRERLYPARQTRPWIQLAKRKWSDAYLVLTQARVRNRNARARIRAMPAGRVVNWISSQSVPEPLPPRVRRIQPQRLARAAGKRAQRSETLARGDRADRLLDRSGGALLRRLPGGQRLDSGRNSRNTNITPRSAERLEKAEQENIEQFISSARK